MQGLALHDGRISKRHGASMGAKDLREAAFLGRITAAFTHEMKNVLATIKESAGLMEDLLALSQETTFPHRDRFVRCLTTIEAQTKRGVELSGRLNRFAHSPDQDIATVDLNDILEQVVVLSGRFARLKGVTLNLHPHEEALSVVVSPVGLQMAIFACLECCWETMAAGGNISLSVTLEGREATVRFCCQNGGDLAGNLAVKRSGAELSEAIQEIATRLNCRIQDSSLGAGFELILPVAG